MPPRRGSLCNFGHRSERSLRSLYKITGQIFTSLSDLGDNKCFRRASEVLKSHQELPLLRRGRQRDKRWVSALSAPFIQGSLLSSVTFVYVFTLDIFEQRVFSINISISVWENKSISYFALSFPHRAPQALEEMV